MGSALCPVVPHGSLCLWKHGLWLPGHWRHPHCGSAAPLGAGLPKLHKSFGLHNVSNWERLRHTYISKPQQFLFFDRFYRRMALQIRVTSMNILTGRHPGRAGPFGKGRGMKTASFGWSSGSGISTSILGAGKSGSSATLLLLRPMV